MSRKRVLWADDEIEFLRAHIMFLETRGYTVIPSHNGDDALELMKKEQFDIVLLDEHMPGKTGLVVLEEIKRTHPDLPVVMVTKSEEEQLMDEALGRKIDGYLTKPVNPSQILSVCKSLLASHHMHNAAVTQNYIREYSENRLSISGPVTWEDWIEIYLRLCNWDMQLENIQDEGLRQTHASQHSECNHLFSAFVMNNYMEWLKGNNRPPMPPDILGNHIAPHLTEGGCVYLFVLSCMRLDQLLCLGPFLQEFFDIKRDCFYSLLPSDTPFSRSALLSGLFPDEIANKYNFLQQKKSFNGSITNQHEKELLIDKFKQLGVNSDVIKYFPVKNDKEFGDFQCNISRLENTNCIALVMDAMEAIVDAQSQSGNILETITDETTLRSATKKWFQNSLLFQTLKTVSRQKCKVVITSDHGSILSTMPCQIYNETEAVPNTRYRYGDIVTADERYVLFMGDPSQYRLPRLLANDRYIIGTENYYFATHTKFANYARKNTACFQWGGISLEEMIVPVWILTPK